MTVDIKQLPLVSVVIPAYNHERFVESAIKSVWNLDYRPMELIVLDDGSRDSTLTIIRGLEKVSPIPMAVIAKENEGICKTLNQGVALAQGKYIAFLASDDEFVPQRMKAQVGFLESINVGNVAGCYGQRCIIDEAGNIIKDIDTRRMDFPNKFLSLIQGKRPFSLQCSTFRSDIVKELGFDETLYFEDWDFFLRLTSKYEFVYVPGLACRYRQVQNSANRNMQRISSARIQIFDKYKSHPAVLRYGARRFRSNVERENAQGCFMVDDFPNARKWLLRSWLSNPMSLVQSLPLAFKLIIGPRVVKQARALKRYVKIALLPKTGH